MLNGGETEQAHHNMAPENADSGWRIDRRIPVLMMGSIIVGMLVQAGVVLFALGGLNQRVVDLEGDRQSVRMLADHVNDLSNRGTGVETQSKFIVDGVVRIEQKVDRIPSK
jgi:hypothetical protein